MGFLDNFDPWNVCTSTRSGATTADVTMESVREACRKLQELAPRPKFGCLVCLPHHFARLKKECHPLDREPMIADRLCGIPVHVESNDTQAMAKAAELMLQGKRVAVVLADETVREFEVRERDFPFFSLWQLACK